jgi:osmotically-inducible protein OsmY
MSKLLKTSRRAARLLAVLGAAAWISGCAPLLVGGAVGGAMMFSYRRTSGTQVEDQAIEVKAANRAREVLGERGHLNFTAYNRTLLITGEVPTEEDRQAVERAAAGVENLRSVVNELGVLGNSSLTARSSDTIITSKVKASFVDAKDLQANAVKVTTERGVVYLQGRVTEREAARATELARGVGGVTKVVRVFEILTEAELTNLTTAK